MRKGRRRMFRSQPSGLVIVQLVSLCTQVVVASCIPAYAAAMILSIDVL
jgi:hypothetical protein